MKRLIFAIVAMVGLLSMEAFASEIKIREDFISDVTVGNTGYDFVLSHSNAGSWPILHDLYNRGSLSVNGLLPSQIFEGIPYEVVSLGELVDKNRESVIYEEGWKQDSNGWWYESPDGIYPSNMWKKIENYWYLFDRSGYMQTGWKQVAGNWYHLNSNGTMAENVWIGNYYVDDSGQMLRNTVTPDGYYVGEDGAWCEEKAVNYGAYMDVLFLKNPTKFAIIDIDSDGNLELLISTVDDITQVGSKLSIYDIVNNEVIQTCESLWATEVAGIPGEPYLATMSYRMECYRRYLLECSPENNRIIMEVERGETDGVLPNWGDKDLYIHMATRGKLLNFVENSKSNQDKYVAGGRETGYLGNPNVGDSFMGWLDNFS